MTRRALLALTAALLAMPAGHAEQPASALRAALARATQCPEPQPANPGCRPGTPARLAHLRCLYAQHASEVGLHHAERLRARVRAEHDAARAALARERAHFARNMEVPQHMSEAGFERLLTAERYGLAWLDRSRHLGGSTTGDLDDTLRAEARAHAGDLATAWSAGASADALRAMSAPPPHEPGVPAAPPQPTLGQEAERSARQHRHHRSRTGPWPQSAAPPHVERALATATACPSHSVWADGALPCGLGSAPPASVPEDLAPGFRDPLDPNAEALSAAGAALALLRTQPRAYGIRTLSETQTCTMHELEPPPPRLRGDEERTCQGFLHSGSPLHWLRAFKRERFLACWTQALAEPQSAWLRPRCPRPVERLHTRARSGLEPAWSALYGQSGAHFDAIIAAERARTPGLPALKAAYATLLQAASAARDDPQACPPARTRASRALCEATVLIACAREEERIAQRLSPEERYDAAPHVSLASPARLAYTRTRECARSVLDTHPHCRAAPEHPNVPGNCVNLFGAGQPPTCALR